MNWNVEFIEEARQDMKRLDHSAQIPSDRAADRRKSPLLLFSFSPSVTL